MHFYTEKNGKVEPRHFVPMSKDPNRTRASRITDAKKALKDGEVWMPSVTTVLNILDKPALVNWKVDKHLDEAYRMARDGQNVLLDEWKDKVKARTQEALDAAPQAGTDIHKILEDYLWSESLPNTLPQVEIDIIKNVEKALAQRGIGAEIEKEKYFINSEHGFAGCADLVSDTWVIDYKSKQEADKFKVGKMQYPEHIRQLAAYGKSMCKDGFRAANIFICLETGEIDFHESNHENLQKGFLTFLDCLSIYKRETYNPLG